MKIIKCILLMFISLELQAMEEFKDPFKNLFINAFIAELQEFRGSFCPEFLEDSDIEDLKRFLNDHDIWDSIEKMYIKIDLVKSGLKDKKIESLKGNLVKGLYSHNFLNRKLLQAKYITAFYTFFIIEFNNYNNNGSNFLYIYDEVSKIKDAQFLIPQNKIAHNKCVFTGLVGKLIYFLCLEDMIDISKGLFLNQLSISNSKYLTSFCEYFFSRPPEIDIFIYITQDILNNSNNKMHLVPAFIKSINWDLLRKSTSQKKHSEFLDEIFIDIEHLYLKVHKEFCDFIKDAWSHSITEEINETANKRFEEIKNLPEDRKLKEYKKFIRDAEGEIKKLDKEDNFYNLKVKIKTKNKAKNQDHLQHLQAMVDKVQELRIKYIFHVINVLKKKDIDLDVESYLSEKTNYDNWYKKYQEEQLESFAKPKFYDTPKTKVGPSKAIKNQKASAQLQPKIVKKTESSTKPVEKKINPYLEYTEKLNATKIGRNIKIHPRISRWINVRPEEVQQFEGYEKNTLEENIFQKASHLPYDVHRIITALNRQEGMHYFTIQDQVSNLGNPVKVYKFYAQLNSKHIRPVDGVITLVVDTSTDKKDELFHTWFEAVEYNPQRLMKCFSRKYLETKETADGKYTIVGGVSFMFEPNGNIEMRYDYNNEDVKYIIFRN